MERPFRAKVLAVGLLLGAGGAALTGCGSTGTEHQPPETQEPPRQGYIETDPGDLSRDPQYHFTQLITPDGLALECAVYGELVSRSSSIDCNFEELNQKRAIAQTTSE